jgi:NADH dehydrogenase
LAILLRWKVLIFLKDTHDGTTRFATGQIIRQKNIVSLVAGKAMQPLHINEDLYGNHSRNKAVVYLITILWCFCWFVWMFVHLFSLIGFKKQLFSLIGFIITFDLIAKDV